MIILDANILLYAYDETSTHHKNARDWVNRVFSSGAPVGIPWQTVGAFLRIVSDPRIPGDRKTPQEAAQVVDRWFEHPNIRFLGPGDQHWRWLRQMLTDGQARGPMVTDAQLAAVTIEHGGELYSTDRDFGRFPGLRWKNPLS